MIRLNKDGTIDGLRPYQKTPFYKSRESLKKGNRAIVVQAPTGSGKTHVQAAMCYGSFGNEKRAWIVVPRNEIADQASDKLKKYLVPHGKIDASHNESRAYLIHVVSKDTLLRRFDKIKNPPDLILWDECHLALDQQILIFNTFQNTRFIGFTATPERNDGRGLSIKTGGIYNDLIMGESIPWMIERNYLSNYKYYAPPLEGLDELHKQGHDFKADEFDALLKRKRIYGQAIEHYGDLANGKPALGFCRDVKSAYETAERFSKYWKAFCIEGKMPKGKRKAMVKALETGEIDMLFNCEIATYGLDIPRVEVGIQLRYTASRALQWQMFGRTIRPYPGKEFSIYIDHVNNWEEFIDERYPKSIPFDIPNIDWNFHGVEKRKWSKKDRELQLTVCHACWKHTTGLFKCEHCGAELKKRKQKKIELVNTQLEEVQRPKLKDLPLAEKRETNDKINSLIEKFEADNQLGKINPGAVGEMIALSEKLGNNIMWVYWQFAKKDIMVNVPLLWEIARQKKYEKARGWVFHKIKFINNKLENEKAKMKKYENAGLFG